jgi:hypothetical protein
MKKIRFILTAVLAFSILFSVSMPSFAQSSIGDLNKKIDTGDIKTDTAPSADSTSAASAESLSTVLDSKGPNGYDGSGNNSCGQYATSTVFNFYGLDETYPVTLKNMNPTGSFTAPDRIVDYWKKSGIDVDYKNKCTLNDIKKQLDSGNPAVCMVDADGSGHWITITGYNKNADGSIKSFVMRDSYWGVRSNHEMSVEEFEKRWTKPLKGTNAILGTVLDYDHLLITPKGKSDGGFSLKNLLNLPNNFSTALNDQIANGANQFCLALGQDVTKIKSIKDFDIKKVNFPRAIAGAAEVLTALPQKLMFGLPGTALKDGGDAIKNWGAKMSQKGGTLDKIVGGAATGVGTVVNTAGKGLTAAGNAVSSVVDSGFKGLRKIFGW